MAFIEEWTYDIKEGEFAAFQEWLRSNEAELAKHAPEGTEYIGTYACVFGDDSKGFARTLVRLDSYGSMDAAVESVRSGGRYSELLREAMSYSENAPTSRGSHQLWKEFVDTVYSGE